MTKINKYFLTYLLWYLAIDRYADSFGFICSGLEISVPEISASINVDSLFYRKDFLPMKTVHSGVCKLTTLKLDLYLMRGVIL